MPAKEVSGAGPNYIEAVIQGGVKLEDVESINIDLSKVESLPGFAQRGYDRKFVLDIARSVRDRAVQKGVKVNVIGGTL